MHRNTIRATVLFFMVALLIMLPACDTSQHGTSSDEISATDVVQNMPSSEPSGNDDLAEESNQNVAETESLLEVYSKLLEDERLSYAEHWIRAAVYLGAAGAEADVEMLAAHFESAENFAVLRLFATRFCETLNSDEELIISTHTALSFANFLLQNGGVDALLHPIDTHVRTDWLHSIGVMREYTDPYEGYLDVFTVTGLNPLVAESDGAIFTIHASGSRVPLFGLDTADRMETFLFREMHAKEYIINWLRENAGDSFDFVYIPDLIRYFIRPYGLVGADSVRNVITLNCAHGHLHEYIHIILRDTGGELRGAWRQEGLAEYLTLIVYPYNYDRMLFEEFGLGRFLSDEGMDKYGDFIQERYFIYTGNELSYPPDMRALLDAFSYGLFLSGDDGWLRGYRGFEPIYQYRQIPHSVLTGDGLGNLKSYPEAAAFIAFLADTYSFETTLRLTETWVSVEEIFGRSYEELHADWIDWLGR